MGVLGLTSFLAKYCPDVLKELPNGIKALSGKTVVIDATLLTQRFHFGGDVPNRHVSGWYRFITNLKANDVNAICVFDGKERNLAKTRELQRRRESRATSVARQKLEVERLEGLTTLKKIVRSLRKLPLKEQGIIKSDLRSIIKAVAPVLPETTPQDADKVNGDLEQVLSTTAFEASTTPKAPTKDSASKVSKRSIKLLTSKLTGAHQRYTESLSNLARLQIPVSAIPLTSSDTPTPLQLELDPDFQASASRHQYQLTLQEGQAWSKLVEDRPDAVENAEDEFQDLQERSSVLNESYRRRNEFPTAQTYEDAKVLLSAMGIPSVQSEVPYEGEGLASAIVLAGYADFVVSEDTDVIVYGAPLLRNVTDKTRSLMEINSQVVCEALLLPRKQFVDFALLLGTDFTPRMKNVGPVRALEFIRARGSIEEIVKLETKYPPRLEVSEYLKQVTLGREIFNTLPPVPSADKIKQLPMDEMGVQTVLEGFGFSKEMLAEGNDFTVALKGNYFGDNPHFD